MFYYEKTLIQTPNSSLNKHFSSKLPHLRASFDGKNDSQKAKKPVSRQSLLKVEEALEAKEAPLNLCAWRLEQRERRPLREQVRDAAEVCLEVETWQ